MTKFHKFHLLGITGAFSLVAMATVGTACSSSDNVVAVPETPDAAVVDTGVAANTDSGPQNTSDATVQPAVLAAPDPCSGVPEPRSCCLGKNAYGGLAGTDKTCGPDHNEECCGIDDVPTSTFNRMNDPTLPATVPGFHLGRYLVTTARLKVWMDEGGGLQANAPPVSPNPGSGAHPVAELAAVTGWQSDWNPGGKACGGVGCLAADASELATRVYKDPASDGPGCTLDHYPDHPNYPASCIGYYEAVAFCAWDGGYLITEAQYESALRGGTDQRQYAWGSDAPDTLDRSVHCLNGGGIWNDDLWCTNPSQNPFAQDVGYSRNGQGKYGTYDLQGNLLNITADEQGDMPATCTNDCVNRPTPTPNREVARGISYAYPNNLGPDAYTDMISKRPVTGRKNFWGANFGFRCAYPDGISKAPK